jgi:hypothetical protein
VSQYREGHEYFVCDECGSHNEVDPEVRAGEFDPDLHEGSEGMFWSATCDSDDCGADLSPFIYNPHYAPEESCS